MRKIVRLKTEALQAAQARGHSLGHFITTTGSDFRRTALAECSKCGAWVQVNTHPAPNQIDIGGPAVAIGCLQASPDQS